IYKIDISNPQLFAENIQALRAVEKVWIEMDIVYCKVKDPDIIYEEIPKIATKLGLQLKGFQRMLGTLEEIYTKTAGGNKNGT
ncbi:MAG: hypothetical protein QW279_10780, partial [Candidatus Jordarchaeaceae archaeon]